MWTNLYIVNSRQVVTRACVLYDTLVLFLDVHHTCPDFDTKMKRDGLSLHTVVCDEEIECDSCQMQILRCVYTNNRYVCKCL